METLCGAIIRCRTRRSVRPVRIRGYPRDVQTTARLFNPQYRERLFAQINDAPFVRHMGMRITDLAWGRATVEMTASEFRLQPFGVVHGGNIATLIDTATFWACFLSLDSDEDGLTSVDLKLNYLAPARVEALRCTGTLIKAGKTIFYAAAEVLTADNRLIAHGTSTLMRLPGLGVKFGIPIWAE
jgi:uncharacterized protein (TIGR00369 family)